VIEKRLRLRFPAEGENSAQDEEGSSGHRRLRLRDGSARTQRRRE
jgi:hypothetical protein